MNSTVSQADITAGTIVNQATTAATDFHGDAANDLSGTSNANDTPTTTSIPSVPSLSITKTADDATERSATDTIVYTYTVTNTGNVAIANVTVNDTHNGSGPPPSPAGETLFNDAAPTGDSVDAASNASWDLLGPGDAVRFTGDYVVTQQDVDTLQ